MSGDRHLGGPAAALIVVALIACSRTAAAPLVAPGAPAPAAPPSTPAGVSAPRREVAAARLPGDSDGDGIRDDVDRCVDAIELRNGVEDDDGCPDVGPAGIGLHASGDRLEHGPILFAVNADRIHDESLPVIAALADLVGDNPALGVIRIEVHSDSRGSSAYNLELTQRRADAIRAALMERGVDPERLRARGFGDTRPIVCDECDSWAKSRRVELWLEARVPAE